MASQGPLFPGTVATQAGPSGDDDWVNPGNISADDGNQATITAASFDAGDDSFELIASNFGFTVPTGSTIDGIIVEVERSNAAGAASDLLVQLRDSTGAKVGSNKAVAGDWPTALTLATYGSSSDTWTAGLDQADIVSTNFGVFFSANADGANTDIGVDFISITVHFTAPPVAYRTQARYGG